MTRPSFVASYLHCDGSDCTLSMRTARSSAADNQCMSLGDDQRRYVQEATTNAHLVKKFCDACCGDLSASLPMSPDFLVNWCTPPCTIPTYRLTPPASANARADAQTARDTSTLLEDFPAT